MQDSARPPRTVREVADGVASVCQLAREQESPAWAGMLLRQEIHALLCMAGRFDEAFSEDLCAEALSYRSLDTGQRIDGRDAVRAFFAGRAGQGEMLTVAVRLRTAVDDWGVATEAVQRTFPLVPAGSTDEASYDELPLSVVSEFDADGRLLAIRVYPAKASVRLTLDPADAVSREQLAAACNALIEQLHGPMASLQSTAPAARS